jgi:hypothetical protein
MNKLLIGATLLALTGAAQAEPMDPAMAAALYGQGGRVCLRPRTSVPAPLPWWAQPFRDGTSVVVPIYMCSPEVTGREQFESCGAPGHHVVPPQKNSGTPSTSFSNLSTY